MAEFLNDEVQDAIRAAVAETETRTDAELIPVIARRADEYRFIPVLYAFFLALALPLPFTVFGLVWPLPWIGIHEAQILLAAGLGLALQLLPIRHYLVPRAIRHRRAALLARAQFIEQRVHMARDHKGVLLFVSVDEHHVEIIADEGLTDLIEDEAWAKATDTFTTAVRAGRVAEGFQDAIKETGDLLERAAPKTEEDKNDLPDRLVVL